MKKEIVNIIACIVVALSFTTIQLHGQSLPAGTAGIVYTYDAAGNRTKVEYVLNNAATKAEVAVTDTQMVAKKTRSQIIMVDALYPNPTTGRITVRLSRPLQNAVVVIMDLLGRAVIRQKESGSLLNFDLSHQPTGIYILHIDQRGEKVTMKIIKR